MKPTWILVADSSRARIFSAETPSSALIEINTLAHPQGRLHEQNLSSDLPGHEASPISGGIFCGEHCPSGDPPVHARFVEFPLARWIDHSTSSEPFAGTDRSPVRHWIVLTPPGNVSKITIGTYSDELTKILHNVPLPIADGPSVGVLPLPQSADSAKQAAKASIPYRPSFSYS